MDMIHVTVKNGQKPTKEQKKEIRAAAKAPITYTADCPETTTKGLAEFAAKAREIRQRMKRVKPAVTIRVTPDCLTKYKSLGKGYTGVMADVLNYAADNPEILSRAAGTTAVR
jgi:uncharacterized protein (DUF4415 family)